MTRDGNEVLAAYTELQRQYAAMTAAVGAFRRKLEAFASLLACMESTPDGDRSESLSDADRECIVSGVASASDKVLAETIGAMKPDLGALADEERVAFVAETVIAEVARRLSHEAGGAGTGRD